MGKTTIDWSWCPQCGKRGFHDEHDADKALGRAQAKRDRTFEKAPSRRGMVRESRAYECPDGLFHLTSESKQTFYRVMGVAA
ncbi:hypothetical protein O7614_26880 [Micromonospora sp. WMMD961]|uniref:hypothetical protein n=1 Tax=Micromonospora sp. WMMD961 TaxID=3016100 RepID=UPI0024167808|nr:hypothetical protein [Micromonospora sp. WMMD961]MDG4783288.1 hypothetical protein [Micromonospora sp. WMMD961]